MVRTGNLGRLLAAPVDVKLAEDETVVPDLVFIRHDRLSIIGPKAIEGAPDLIAEILSPSTRHHDLGKKKALYARFGMREYLAIDPEARILTVFVLRGDH